MSTIPEGTSSVNILIAEDSPTQAQRLKHILEQNGYEVTHVANGRLALEAAQRRKPTLIISDVVMPEMNGYELCRCIKDDSNLADVPVFLVTTLSDPHDVIRGLECRADNFILKPYDEQHLLSRVRYMLLNREMGQADRLGMGVEISFNGQRHFITSDRLQILNLLISTYDAAIQRNKELSRTQEELRESNKSLRETNRKLEQEIKERELAQRALRASEENLAVTLQSIGDGVLTTDAQGRITRLNGVAEQLTGWKLADALWRQVGEIFNIIHDKTRQPALIPVADTLTKGTIHGLANHTILIARDGTERFIGDSCAPIRNNEGTVIGAVLVFRDVTEEVRLTKELHELNANLEHLVIERTGELRESAGRFRQLAENIDEVFWLSDLSDQRQILYVSPAYEKIWGRTCASLYASMQSWFEAIHPDDRQRIVQTARDKQMSGTYSEEYRVVRPDGAIRWIMDSGFPVRNEAGEVYRIAGVAKDVTERKQSEDTRRTLEEQLRQSQKMQAIGQLAGGIAHDFNNLMTVVVGYSAIAIDRYKADGKTRDALALINKTGERAAQLTRQLLAFSRKQVCNPKIMNLNDVAADMDKMLRQVIGEDILLSSCLDPQLACVKSDPNQIEQIIMNLAVNARDAMPKGGTLSIQTLNAELNAQYCARHADVRPGQYAVLSVSDTGCGMDTETIIRIFEPFFTTKEPGKGTGLGLATVYGIVKQHEGHIEVESRPGQGTTFRIFLPHTSETAAREAGVIHAKPSMGHETVLVVEDEEDVRSLVRSVLEHNGYNVLIAASGGEALQCAERHKGPIHILVSDVVMPGMSGSELSALMTAAHPSLRVLFMSGHAEKLFAERDSATINLIQKPFTPDALARKIREVLDSVESSNA